MKKIIIFFYSFRINGVFFRPFVVFMLTCGCITFVGLIKIAIKKISYKKSVQPINVPTISARVTESTGKYFSKALILASTNPQYDKRLFIELRVQYMNIESSELVEWINCSECQSKNNLCTQHVLSLQFSCTELAIQWIIRHIVVSWCKNKYFWQRFTCITVIQPNGEELDEFEIQSRSPINADPIHLEEENVESLENINMIQPLNVSIENNEPKSSDVENPESEETPEMPDQIVLCYNNRKFNPSMISSTGLSFLFVIIFIVGPLLIWKYFLFVGYENLELKTHILLFTYSSAHWFFHSQP